MIVIKVVELPHYVLHCVSQMQQRTTRAWVVVVVMLGISQRPPLTPATISFDRRRSDKLVADVVRVLVNLPVTIQLLISVSVPLQQIPVQQTPARG